MLKMRAVVAFCLATWLGSGLAAKPVPVIGIIIDDMGNTEYLGQSALDLPGALTYSFLPHTPFSVQLARKAFHKNKEIMLHLPMEAQSGRALGSGGLTMDLDQAHLKKRLLDNLHSIPFAVGVNNHMGSRMTRDALFMQAVMQQLKKTGGLYFVDSRTHVASVAEKHARKAHLPTSRRDIFLDNQRDTKRINQQFDRLIAKAKRKGSAIAIGHPYPETLQVLKQRLTHLREEGVTLLPISQVIKAQKRLQLWHASLSHSPKVVKNSKPSP